MSYNLLLLLLLFYEVNYNNQLKIMNKNMISN